MIIVFIIVASLFFDCASAKQESIKQTIGEELATPITTDAKYILAAGALLTVGLVLIKNEFGGDETQTEATHNRPMGDASPFFDYMGQLVPNALYAGGMYWNYKLTDNRRSYNRALAMTKASAYSSVVTTAIKYSVREKRPNGTARNSFPSGHATTAFAFASVVGIEHGIGWGIPAYMLAGGVAYSRLNDNAHYTHDVIAGATIGMAYGIGLALHQEGLKKIKSLPLLTPTLDGKGINISYLREF